MTHKGNNMFIDAEKEGYNVKYKKILSEEHKMNLSLALKGNTNTLGKTWKWSEESKKKARRKNKA
jgi:hypothetical protein